MFNNYESRLLQTHNLNLKYYENIKVSYFCITYGGSRKKTPSSGYEVYILLLFHTHKKDTPINPRYKAPFLNKIYFNLCLRGGVQNAP